MFAWIRRYFRDAAVGGLFDALTVVGMIDPDTPAGSEADAIRSAIADKATTESEPAARRQKGKA